MLFGIAAFEFRYQLRNPVFWVAVAIFFLLGFGITASENVSLGTPGQVHENSPYAIAIATAVFSLFYLLIVTAFVANAIVRDDSSGFAPIVRATSVTRMQFVIGRFAGGLLIAWLGYLSIPVGMALGSMMPWVDPETVGPQVLSYYAWNFAVFALPNVFLTSALLFAVATVLRSMMASYIAAVVLVMAYLTTISVVGQDIEYRDLFARYELLGNGALAEATRYWTQADMNSRLVALEGKLLFNRLLAIGAGLLLLALTVWRFSMSERRPSRRKLRKLARAEARTATAAAVAPKLDGGRVTARDAQTSRWIQFIARLRIEMRQVLTSPGLLVLVVFAMGMTAMTLWSGQTIYGTPPHATLSSGISAVRGGFTVILLMIAAFYGGELVWRERDRKMNELIDSTAVPAWVMTVPKVLAIFLVLLTVNVAAMLIGILYNLTGGAASLGIREYFLWFMIPAAIDGLLIAVLALFFQVLSPNKYVGWGILFVWFVGSIFLSNMGLSNPLYNYASAPAVPLSDLNGVGSFWVGSAVFQLYWMLCALILAVLAHVLWPRGTDVGLKVRSARFVERVRGIPLAIIGIAAVAMAATGAYAYHNTTVVNRYQTSDDVEALLAGFERKYLKYETLPRPEITNVTLDVHLYPEERRLVATGRYELRNNTGNPIREVHVRQGSQDVEFLKLDLAGASLVSDDEAYGYRIFRFDDPLAPGETASLDFVSRIWHRGFRAFAPATDVIENGTFVTNFAFAPIIGMNRQNLLTDRAQRRRQGLPAELRPAKLEDMSATARNYVGSDWVMSDITLTTDAAQVPIAPGERVSDRTSGDRRTARFVSSAPILNFFSIQSADYEVARRSHDGIDLSVFYHQGHEWNVPKMLNAMATSLDYYGANFGPYQFDYARVVEFPRYANYAQAFAGTMPYSESVGFVADTTDADEIDFVTYIVAHEMAHQYWAHQVVGGDMQGGTLLSETLAQYSALMVMKQLYGPDKIRRFLKYELDQYLGGRKGEAVEELPLLRVENQGYVHYRKGAVAMYLLQERLGEDAVNDALARFLASFRFEGPPYPRSVDLVRELRKEARNAEEQQLITDLFERITLYDLKVTDAVARREGDGWTTTVTIDAAKYYADGKGRETETELNEAIEVGLFTDRPGLEAFSAEDVLTMGRERLRDGTQRITLRSRVKPTFVGVDPYNFFIDRNSDDNVRAVDGA